MVRQLYLLRHAQSPDKQRDQSDRERELSPEGVKETMKVGGYLKNKNFQPDTIITSPAYRALATARLVGDILKTDPSKVIEDEELYQASVRTFYNFITGLDDAYHTVMCVGHNPAISYLAEYLTRAEIGDMVPAGLAIIKFNAMSWKETSQGTGELLEYIHPRIIVP